MTQSADQRRPRILVLSFSPIFRDARVLRHIAALHETYTVVTCGFGEAPPGAAEHIRLDDPPAVSRPARLAGEAELLARRFMHFYWSRPVHQQAARLLAGATFDVILANDIDSLPVALRVAEGTPVVADLHEYFPRWRDSIRRWRMVQGPYMDYLCRTFLPATALDITVADTLAREYESNYSVEFHSILNAAFARQPSVRPTGSPIRLVHSGSSAPNRQLDVMIAGAAAAENTVLDMYLVPTSAPEVARLRSMAEATTNVRVLDAVPVADLPATHDSYDVGLSVLSTATYNTRFSLPNKLFDFVQSGLGIIVGPSPEMARMVRSYGMGAVLDDFTPEDLARVLRSLTAEEVDHWKAATCAAADELSGEVQAEKLRELISQVLPR